MSPFDIRAFVVSRLASTRVVSRVADAITTAAGVPLVGTHDGSFHCDEAMACGVLHFTEAYRNMTIIRSRVPDELKQCRIAVDVGAVYDPSSLRLDHHQAEFNDHMVTPLKRYRTRLSSAGLVYRHFGREVIANFAKELVSAGELKEPLNEQTIDLVYDELYRGFVEHVDGIDNGVEEFSSTAPMQRNYVVSTTLAARVAALHPRWNRPSADPEADNHQQFAAAMTLCATEFLEHLERILLSWLPARGLVEQAFKDRFTVHPSGRILKLAAGGCPWKEHLVAIEESADAAEAILYVCFPDERGGGRVQCVPKKDSSFANRKPLPWRGLRDDALCEASGVSGSVFVHVSGFIGGNKTMDGAIQMARRAVEMPEAA